LNLSHTIGAEILRSAKRIPNIEWFRSQHDLFKNDVLALDRDDQRRKNCALALYSSGWQERISGHHSRQIWPFFFVLDRGAA
jgi:hypothetical protein